MKIKNLDVPEYKSGTARAKWFTAIKRYNGKEFDDFVAATTSHLTFPVRTRFSG